MLASYLDGALAVGLGEPRPPRKIVDRRRPSWSEVTGGKLAKRFVALALFRGGNTLVEERISELLTASSTAANQPVLLGVHDDPRETHRVVRFNPRPGQRVAELRARELLSIAERFCKHSPTLFENGAIDAQRLVVMTKNCLHSRASELEHPANVGRGDEVPCRPQQVGAQNRAVGELLLHLGV